MSSVNYIKCVYTKKQELFQRKVPVFSMGVCNCNGRFKRFASLLFSWYFCHHRLHKQ